MRDPEKSQHRQYMQRCLQLAQMAAAKGNPPSGALIVREDKLIAEAEEASYTRNDITCPAEIEVIRLVVSAIGTDLFGCTLYCSHEPCVMCAYAIRYYRISRVVIDKPVAFFGSVTSSCNLLASTSVPPHWYPPPEIVWPG